MARTVLLLALGEDGKGQLIDGDRCYRVTGSYMMHPLLSSSHSRFEIKLSVDESLNEKEQLTKIGRLKAQLENEQEKLEVIRKTVAGESLEDES